MVRSVTRTHPRARAYAETRVPEIVAQGNLRDLDLKALGAKYQEGELGELQFPFSGLSLDDMIATYDSAGELDLDLPRRGMLNWDGVSGRAPGTSGVSIQINGNDYLLTDIVVQNHQLTVPAQQGIITQPPEGYYGKIIMRWTTALPGPDALYESLAAAVISAGLVGALSSSDLFDAIGSNTAKIVIASVLFVFLLVVTFVAIRWVYQNVIQPITKTLQDLNKLGVLGPLLIVGGIGVSAWALSRHR